MICGIHNICKGDAILYQFDIVAVNINTNNLVSVVCEGLSKCAAEITQSDN